jgi:hypothetical protein
VKCDVRSKFLRGQRAQSIEHRVIVPGDETSYLFLQKERFLYIINNLNKNPAIPQQIKKIITHSKKKKSDNSIIAC